jgi:predicted ArsR family transcriptional regulator
VKNQAHCQQGRTIKRFFFNIREGDELIEDPDGTLLLDLTSAISEANGAARELLAAQTEMVGRSMGAASRLPMKRAPS